MEKQDPLIHPETGNEIQKRFYISVPYFPGLSESFKKIFKYTPVQGMLQRSQHPEIHAHAPKRTRSPMTRKKDLVLSLGMQSRWVVNLHTLEKRLEH